MDKNSAIAVFESLASGVRLDVFRMLVRQGSAGMVAGEIATALELPATNISFHLKAMAHAGLVTAVQEGRFQRYRANMPLMLDLIAYLTAECCSGQAQACGIADASALFPPCAASAPEPDLDNRNPA